MASNPLQSILSKFSGLIKTNSGGSAIGIDIGASAIKIVQIKKESGRAVLETYGSLSLGPYAEGQVGQVVPIAEEQLVVALNDLLKESNTTTKNSAISIPASASLVFLMELPPVVNQKDLSGIIQTEARKYIPVPITEVSLDWWVIPKRAEENVTDDSPKPTKQDVINEKTKVLVAAIHNDTLNKYQGLVTDVKLQTDFFEIEMFSNIRAIIGQDLSTVMIVDIGASKTKVSIVDRGVIQDFHIVNKGSQDITISLSVGLQIPFAEAEENKKRFGLEDNPKYPKAKEITQSTLDYIFFEINNVVLNYEKKYNNSIEKVILTGGGVMLKNFMEIAPKKFGTEVSLGNPFSKIQSPAFLEDVLAESGPEFGVAAGLALRKLN
ncbi:MAG: type IV pilus assembly protein PilM [Candidatus Paceibacterota bacterium]